MIRIYVSPVLLIQKESGETDMFRLRFAFRTGIVINGIFIASDETSGIRAAMYCTV